MIQISNIGDGGLYRFIEMVHKPYLKWTVNDITVGEESPIGLMSAVTFAASTFNRVSG